MTAEPGRMTSRQARAEQTRLRLLDAAINQFSDRHYDEVAVSDIAQSAGVAHGLVFHYFENKRGIYLEAMREAARQLDHANQVPQDLPPGRQFRLLLEMHLDYLARHRGLALRLVLGGRGTDPEAWELFEADRWRAMEWLCARLGLDFHADAVRIMLRAAIGAVDAATAYWLEQDQGFDAPKLIGELVELVVSCLRSAARLDPGLDVEDAVKKLRAT
jgi:AcrR family transcriptional regulator